MAESWRQSGFPRWLKCRYKPLAEYSVAEYMNENDIEHYIYRVTDMELSRKIEFDPGSLMDEAE